MEEEYSYFKKPWQKWLSLLLAMLMLFFVYARLKDMAVVINSDIYSPENMAEYIVQQENHIFFGLIICSGLLVQSLFISASKSRKSARKGETICCLALGLALLGWIAFKGIAYAKVLNAGFGILFLLLSGYSFYRYKNNK